MNTFRNQYGIEMVTFPYSSYAYHSSSVTSKSGLPLSECCGAPVEMTGGGVSLNDHGHSYGMDWRAKCCASCGRKFDRTETHRGSETRERKR